MSCIRACSKNSDKVEELLIQNNTDVADLLKLYSRRNALPSTAVSAALYNAGNGYLAYVLLNVCRWAAALESIMDHSPPSKGVEMLFTLRVVIVNQLFSILTGRCKGVTK